MGARLFFNALVNDISEGIPAKISARILESSVKINDLLSFASLQNHIPATNAKRQCPSICFRSLEH